jgi:hypothetical protein
LEPLLQHGIVNSGSMTLSVAMTYIELSAALNVPSGAISIKNVLAREPALVL